MAILRVLLSLQLLAAISASAAFAGPESLRVGVGFLPVANEFCLKKIGNRCDEFSEPRIEKSEFPTKFWLNTHPSGVSQITGEIEVDETEVGPEIYCKSFEFSFYGVHRSNGTHDLYYLHSTGKQIHFANLKTSPGSDTEISFLREMVLPGRNTQGLSCRRTVPHGTVLRFITL